MLDFPSAPTLNQLFTGGPGGVTVWRWDGAKWAGSGGAALQAVIVVTGSTTLPAGYAGLVRVENAAAAPITIILPAAPTVGQKITLKDTAGNAGSFPVMIQGSGIGSLIEGAAS